MKPPIEERDGVTLLRVTVQPKSSRNRHSVDSEGRLKVFLTAPPVDGAANAALCAYIAKALGVSKGAVSLDQGVKSRSKTVRVAGVARATVAAAFALPGSSIKKEEAS